MTRLGRGRPRVLLLAAWLSALLVAFVAAGEIIARMKGVQPWQVDHAPIRVEPGGKLYQPHPTLGYTHLPGAYTVTLGSGYSFEVTHGSDTLRVTRAPDRRSAPAPRGEMWIFGDSYTHGWSLDDDETYPWLLQERFPGYDVVNFGVNGYGTVHSLFQFREALATRRPGIAILSYASFHDVRNTFSRSYRKFIVPWNHLGPLVQPYARLDPDGELSYSIARVEYPEFPLMRSSALAHYLEILYNRFELERHRAHSVTRAVVAEMAALAAEHDVRLVVAAIDGDRMILEFAEAAGIPGVDISVDLDEPGNRNLPHDPHPSAAANMQFAGRLEGFLRAEVMGRGAAAAVRRASE